MRDINIFVSRSSKQKSLDDTLAGIIDLSDKIVSIEDKIFHMEDPTPIIWRDTIQLSDIIWRDTIQLSEIEDENFPIADLNPYVYVDTDFLDSSIFHYKPEVELYRDWVRKLIGHYRSQEKVFLKRKLEELVILKKKLEKIARLLVKQMHIGIETLNIRDVFRKKFKYLYKRLDSEHSLAFNY